MIWWFCTLGNECPVKVAANEERQKPHENDKCIHATLLSDLLVAFCQVLLDAFIVCHVQCIGILKNTTMPEAIALNYDWSHKDTVLNCRHDVAKESKSSNMKGHLNLHLLTRHFNSHLSWTSGSPQLMAWLESLDTSCLHLGWLHIAHPAVSTVLNHIHSLMLSVHLLFVCQSHSQSADWDELSCFLQLLKAPVQLPPKCSSTWPGCLSVPLKDGAVLWDSYLLLSASSSSSSSLAQKD